MARVTVSSRLLFMIGGGFGLVHCGDGQAPPPRGQPSEQAGAAAGTTGAPGSGGATASGGTVSVNIGGASLGGAAAVSPCQGLECQQTTCTVGDCTVPACANGEATSLSGVVYDPAGKIPLYNVVVYVPNGPVPAFSDGASCDRCDASIANPVAAALTDTEGAFVLEDVPVGTDIPLVIQIGKWRRQITVPTVTGCVDTPLMDPTLTRLPRNKQEGDIPLIAITTGGADSMECLPRRMGIDAAEFTTEAGDGRIHLYSGHDNGESIATKQFSDTLNAGATLTRSTQLWDQKDSLAKYDIVILSCEGATIEDEKPAPSRQAMYDYAAMGGRVFASHWHHVWFSKGPDPVPAVGTWLDRADPQDPAVGTINTSFPKGADFASWLVNVSASTTLGQLEILKARDNLHLTNATYATEWITIPENTSCISGRLGCEDEERNLEGEELEACIANCNQNPGAVEYISFNTPLTVPEEERCGRMVYTDVHVSATGEDKPGQRFPESCEDRELSAQEKAVAFMLFDLSACIQDDDDPPMIPVVPR
jgi:hypothetical protein